LASQAELQTRLSELFQRLNATENAINVIEALPTRDRLSDQNQAGLRALEAQRSDIRQQIEQTNEDLELLTTIFPDDPSFGTSPETREATRTPIVSPAPVEEPDLGDAAGPVLPVENPDEPAQINQAALDRLRQQSAAEQNRKPQGTGDWRVKLRLASSAQYFYNLPKNQAGILWPLQATDGVVFPYTPSIQILYAADYNTYQPTHSNYQHYFYKGSKVGEVVMTATFTAQDTEEANYLLAVIHFLKSASKMFYGQDSERGSPPPLLFLTGLGEYQFNEAPCVISQFNYILPNDVDYIRAGPNVQQIRAGTLQYDLRNKNTGAALTSWSSSINRLLTTPGLLFDAERKDNRISSQPVNLSSDDATYVPTKIEMTITLLPVQNRLQVSEGFSLKEYANGSLIKGGFW
jgi:hypothetical protein